MRGKWAILALAVTLVASIAVGQSPVRTAVDKGTMYCSGVVSTEPVPHDSYIVSGEQSDPYFVFRMNDLVYVSRGANQGVKVGDEFSVVRPENDPYRQVWFRGQSILMHAMGQPWADLGRIRIVHVDAKVSTAQVIFECDYMQRGDIILPFVERRPPTLKPNSNLVDPFAPAAGKTGMVVMTKDFGQLAGNNDVVFVNLGLSQGVQVGSYLRVFRHQGQHNEIAYTSPGMVDHVYGYGSTPVRYTWEGLPREILGEGIVVRVSNNTATLLITGTRHEIYVGDYVEVE
jgi:hypothetical protein